MPIEAKRPERGGIAAARRLFLDDLVEHVPERIVARRDEVGRHARAVDELHRRRVGGVGELVDLEVLLDRFDAGLRGAINDEGAKDEPIAVGVRPQDEIPRRHLALVAGRQDEILAAFAMVFSGDTDIADPAIPEVVHQSEHFRGRFDDQRALLGVDPHEVVDRVVVGREFDGARINEIFPDDIRLVDGAELCDRIAHACLVHDRDGHEVGLQGARAIEVVVDLLDGVGRRVAVA